MLRILMANMTRVPDVSHVLATLAIAVVALVAWPGPARSQDPLEESAVWRLMHALPSDPNERLALSEEAFASLKLAGVSEAALEVDILRIKTSALIELGRLAEAARVSEQKAKIVQENGLTIEHDPVTFYRNAEDLHARSGRFDAAARAEIATRTLLTDRARTGHDSPSRAPRKSEVSLLYATDRSRGGEADLSEFYTSERGDLERGEASISIPPDHRRGRLEKPSLLRLEFDSDPKHHVTLDAVLPLTPEVFDARIRHALDDASSREILVYIHGYNVSFDAAMRRAGQLAYDLQYDGVPIVYSWPSRGSTFGYVSDTSAVRHSARNLASFLKDLVTHNPDEVIHIVAHSMGNVALSDALELLALQLDPHETPLPVFREIVFAAPDVDAGLFGRMHLTFEPLAERMTVYGSSEDVALRVSRRLHGDAPRVGHGGEGMVTFSGIDSIDMSAAGDDLLAHDYFAENHSALIDILTIIWRGTPAENRCGLEAVDTSAGTAWRMDPEACADRRLLDILVDLRAIGASGPEDVAEYLDHLEQGDALSGRTKEFILRLFSPAEL